MAPKIIAFLLTLTINAVAGIVILLTMLIAMNGYSESDAAWGLGAYVVMAAAVSILTSVGAVLLLTKMIKRQFSSLVSLLIGIGVFAILGIVLEIVSSLIGIGVAEFVRVNR